MFFLLILLFLLLLPLHLSFTFPGLVLASLDTPLPQSFRVRYPGLRRTGTAAVRLLHRQGKAAAGTAPSGNTPKQCPPRTVAAGIFYVTTRAPLLPRLFPILLVTLGTDPKGHLSPAMATRCGHPCASAIQFETLVLEWHNDTVETHCCAALALDYISTTMPYTMWREEHYCTPKSAPVNLVISSCDPNPVQSCPVLSSPVQSCPGQSRSSQSYPLQSRPVLSSPVQSSPVLSSPGQSRTVQSCPLQSSPGPSRPSLMFQFSILA
jgi:hypothetical protein